MRWALSVDLRERIVSCRKDGMTYQEIAEALRVGEATVSRILRLWRETGQLEPSKIRGHTRPKLEDDDRAVLVELVAEAPDATLVELADDLHGATGKRVSRSTVGLEPRKLGITRKNNDRRPRTLADQDP